MQQSYVTINAAALLAIAVSCRTPAPMAESKPDQVVGCFRRLYADGPPRSGAGGAVYTLTTDAGSTTRLDVGPALLDSAGGVSRLDGSRVSAILSPAEDSTDARRRMARVVALRREASRC
jgi:hypothetical protein